MKKDYYEILGLNKNATESEIKKAYRNLSKIHHPDVSENKDDSKFKEIAEAYEYLSNPEKKAHYDRFGHSKAQDMHNGFDNVSDILNQFMRQNGFNRTQTVRKGDNLTLTVKLTLEEIFNGVKKQYKYQRVIHCKVCEGKGGVNVNNCTTCNGTGHIMNQNNTAFGSFITTSTCHVCSGEGKVFDTKCNSCTGNGVLNNEEVIELVIPIGVQEHMNFLMKDKGNFIKNGVAGDLIVKFMQLPHKSLVRNGNDLKLNLKVSYPQLVLGDKIDIDIIEGDKIRITLPEYSNISDTLRISKKGMKSIEDNNFRGDLVISLILEVPKNIGEKERKIIESLRDFNKGELK